MKKAIVLGLQYGDEGKGKIVDLLVNNFDLCMRFQGGNNAGHTIITGDKKYVFQHLPSGVLYPHVILILGNGMVISPQDLETEISILEKENIEWKGRIKISNTAHIILPQHKELDRFIEQKKIKKIGTTSKGIGPAYFCKVARQGIRIGDIQPSEEFKEKISQEVSFLNTMLGKKEFQLADTVNNIYESLMKFYEKYSFCFTDTADFFYNQERQREQKLLLEGAQGTLLDIDHGSYPFVTSSTTTIGGAYSGSGLPPHSNDKIYGVFKAYTTRVGEGFFPTELNDEAGKKLGEIGDEFGTTTGRKRRCGWLDLCFIRKAIYINGITHLIITKVDILSSFDTLYVCNAYKYNGEIRNIPPTLLTEQEQLEPIYEKFTGWHTDISQCSTYEELPSRCHEFLSFIENQLGIKINIISVGPHRNNVIFMA